ncbi:MAG: hypothetical protein RLZZ396_1915, partial [Planctomycetota bacterium]
MITLSKTNWLPWVAFLGMVLQATHASAQDPILK